MHAYSVQKSISLTWVEPCEMSAKIEPQSKFDLDNEPVLQCLRRLKGESTFSRWMNLLITHEREF